MKRAPIQKPIERQDVVFRAWRIDPRTGRKLWARAYGKRAWAIPVR